MEMCPFPLPVRNEAKALPRQLGDRRTTSVEAATSTHREDNAEAPQDGRSAILQQAVGWRGAKERMESFLCSCARKSSFGGQEGVPLSARCGLAAGQGVNPRSQNENQVASAGRR
jgi:hypothetical protein